MFFCFILLVVSLMTFLGDFRVSSCDTNCADRPVFTPSRLVVKFGDPAYAVCSLCQHSCKNSNTYGLEKSVGVSEENGTTLSWTVARMTEWGTAATCHYTDEANGYNQCCSILPVTVYQPPDDVSISFVNHMGPMFEGRQYTLQCSVQNVAPVQNLTVTFYRGRTRLGSPQPNSNTENKKPVNETFTLNITPSKDDDGVKYSCEAKLDLGPEGPQLPPVVMSESITSTVFYKPRLDGPSHPDPVVVAEGSPLHLNCSAVGNPSPSHTWTLPSARSSPSGGSVLTIQSVTSEDRGQYTCSVSNDEGAATVTFTVVVQDRETTPPSTTAPTTTTSTATTRPQKAAPPNSGSNNALIHRFTLCFMLLFSALAMD